MSAGTIRGIMEVGKEVKGEGSAVGQDPLLWFAQEGTAERQGKQAYDWLV